MKFLSELISAQLISIYDKKNIGYVVDVLYSKNYKKINKLIIADNTEEYTKTLEVKDIYKLGEQFVLVKNDTKLIVCENNFNLCGLMNKKIIDINGKYYGKINDIEFDENWNIINLKTDTENIELNNLLCVGEYIILNSKNMPKKLSNFAPKNKFKIDSKSNIQNVKISPLTPTPVRVQPNQLIGKRLKRDFIVMGNQILAHRNSVINTNLILMAKRLNVLKELELIAY